MIKYYVTSYKGARTQYTTMEEAIALGDIPSALSLIRENEDGTVDVLYHSVRKDTPK